MSVLRNAGEDAVKKALNVDSIDTKYIVSDSAYDLVKLIYQLPEVVIDAGNRYEPSVLTRHVVDIAQSFNRFYHDEHILVDNEEEKRVELHCHSVYSQEDGVSTVKDIIDFENPACPISAGDYQVVANHLKLSNQTIMEKSAGLSRNIGGMNVLGNPGSFFGSRGVQGSFCIEFWL